MSTTRFPRGENRQQLPKDPAQTDFNYGAEAELFIGNNARSKKRIVRHMPFRVASAAIRFAVEDLAPGRFPGSFLESGNARFDHYGIRKLYDSPLYPLKRKRVPVPAMAKPPPSGLPHSEHWTLR